MRSTIVRAAGFLCALSLAVAMSACGGDGTDAASGVERYCELVAELEEIGSAAFEAVDADENATEEDFIVANTAFFESNQAKFDEMIEVAPSEIKADVQLIVDGIAGQAGAGPEVPTEETTAATERVGAYEDENC